MAPAGLIGLAHFRSNAHISGDMQRCCMQTQRSLLRMHEVSPALKGRRAEVRRFFVYLRIRTYMRTPGKQPGQMRTAPFSISTHPAAHGGPREACLEHTPRFRTFGCSCTCLSCTRIPQEYAHTATAQLTYAARAALLAGRRQLVRCHNQLCQCQEAVCHVRSHPPPGRPPAFGKLPPRFNLVSGSPTLRQRRRGCACRRLTWLSPSDRQIASSVRSIHLAPRLQDPVRHRGDRGA